MARAVEDSLFRQLVECENEIFELFRDLVSSPAALAQQHEQLVQAQQPRQQAAQEKARAGARVADGPLSGSPKSIAESPSSSSSSAAAAAAMNDAALAQMIALRTQDEENCLSRLQDDYEATEREYTKVSKLSQVQRAEMLRLVRSVAKEYRLLEATAAKEESELLRVQQETQDVVARTAGTRQRIVRELFQL